MPDELTPSSDFFTDVRGILSDARRVAYTAVNSFSDFPKRPSKIQNQQSPIFNPLFYHYRTVLPTEAELIAELERERRVIVEKKKGGEI